MEGRGNGREEGREKGGMGGRAAVTGEGGGMLASVRGGEGGHLYTSTFSV